MKLTCLSAGRGYHCPPSYMLELSGFRILLECPLDLSALAVFSPISTSFRPASTPEEASGALGPSDLVKAVPWFKTVSNLHLWNPSLIDAVLISSPMAMLGLPFLTHNPRFSGKIYATEAALKLGRLMMEDLVSMHVEFVRFYGPDRRPGFPDWMRWEELEKLHPALRAIVLGESVEELGSWLPLYSAEDIKECVGKVVSLRYAEEVCHNNSLTMKAFSSGLEIGSCNWTISGPRRNMTYLTSSILQSVHAMDFSYCSLRGNDMILFADASFFNSGLTNSKNTGGGRSPDKTGDKDFILPDILTNRSMCSMDSDKEEEQVKSLFPTDDCSAELDKIAFICSCIMDSIQGGGSVLIPIGRLGIILLLLEQILLFLDSSDLKVPVFMISAAAEETLAYANVVPEWLCKQRQDKLFSGEPLFGHVEFIKDKKLHVFPVLTSPNLLYVPMISSLVVVLSGPDLRDLCNGVPSPYFDRHTCCIDDLIKEPCIVFSSHWSLRLGPAVHLLYRWHADPTCLLILEDEIDTEVALLPFKPLTMKILQCSFLSGLKMPEVQPLLKMLQPKLVMFPEAVRCQQTITENHSPFLYYSESATVRVPSLQDDFDAYLATDLAFQLQPRRLADENMAIARLNGQFLLSKGKYLLVPAKKPVNLLNKQLLHWGSVDPILLLQALQEKGLDGMIHKHESISDNGSCFIHINMPEEAVIETDARQTIISAANETIAGRIYEALCRVFNEVEYGFIR